MSDRLDDESLRDIANHDSWPRSAETVEMARELYEARARLAAVEAVVTKAEASMRAGAGTPGEQKRVADLRRALMGEEDSK